jgi:hypothetical protein
VEAGANGFLEGGDTATGEDADRSEERPEEALASVAERVARVGCPGAGHDRDHEEYLDAEVRDVGECLGEDGRRSGHNGDSSDTARLEQRDAEGQVDGDAGAFARAHRTS